MTMLKRSLAGLCAAAVLLSAADQKKLPKPGWNLFKKEQDVQLGQEYAKQIEQQYTIVDNKELTDYINRIGQRLVTRGGLDQYPYFFKVVNEPSINAFALPGGPMFVHTGFIKAADNEDQIAGVLAHELAHVVLRHGTNQASKAQLLQLPAMLAGAMAGGSLAGQLAQLGIGLGANSLMLKYSRGAESDADLLGAYTMAKAGYNPLELGRFFEKIEAEMGSKANSKVAQFFSDHPNPGNRTKAIEEQLSFMPRGDYNKTEGDLKRMHSLVQGLPAPPPRKAAAAAGQTSGASQGGSAPANVPLPQNVQASAQFKTYQGSGFRIGYPDNWEVSNGQSVTIAPKEGRVQDGLGYGVMITAAQPKSGRVSLEQDTQQLLKSMTQQNANMRMEAASAQANIGGSSALVTRMSSDSPYARAREIDVIITIDRGTQLYYLIFVAPESDYGRLEPVFQQMARSLEFR